MQRHPTVGYVAPFAVFVGVMGAEHALALPVQAGYPIRVALTLLVLLATRRDKMKLRPIHVAASTEVGIAVFAIWIAPDTLIGYRHHWLFENALTGKAGGTLSPALQSNIWFLFIRVAGSALLVPVIEELFWRACLMRWLIDRNFECVPLGKYVPTAFWLTAILFAGGLAAGRCVSLIVDGRPAFLLLTYLAAELGVVMIGYWVFRLQK